MGAMRSLGATTTTAGFTFTFVGDRGVEETATLAQAASLPFEEAEPIREPQVYRGQRHFPGFYAAVTSGRLLQYESWLERRWLMLLDFDPAVAEFATQPFELRWLDPEDKTVTRRHTPDIFVRHVGGSAAVYDVRPVEHRENAKHLFDATQQACAALGWGYELVDRPQSMQVLHNIEWLAGYRRPVDDFNKWDQQLLAAAKQPISIDTLVRRVDGSPVARACVFHLLWHHKLATDLADAPLSGATIVEKA